MSKMIIDGTNAITGRLASYAAKQALQGNEIVILNSEKAIISGKKASIVESYMVLRKKGGHSQKGPKISKSPEKIVKRAIRGMLPNYREGRGREAWKRIKCYIGIPEGYKDAKMIKSGKEKSGGFITIKKLGGEL